MKNRAKGRVPEQAGAGLLFTAQQLLLPMIEGLVHSRRELFAWVQQVGISALNQLFELEAVELAGPKGKHSSPRSHYRWGSAQIALPFGGRQIVVPCPRVRGVEGGEAHLKSVEQFRASDPVPGAGIEASSSRRIHARLWEEPGTAARRDRRARREQERGQPPSDRAHDR
jgi:hypothetical protein